MTVPIQYTQSAIIKLERLYAEMRQHSDEEVKFLLSADVRNAILLLRQSLE